MTPMISVMEPARAYLNRQLESSGLTRAEMARALGMSKSHLGRVLDGDRPVTLALAQRLRAKYPELLTIVVSQITAPEPVEAAG